MAKKNTNTTTFYGTGRRKDAIARVRILAGKGEFTVNGKSLDEYMSTDVLKVIAKQPLVVTGNEGKFDVIVKVIGGGNGSYAYTDNSTLGATEAWKDYYYDGGSDAASSLTALNAFRPNVEKSLVHISGNYDPEATETVNESNRVYVTGRVYCGGNSATLAPEAGSTNESSVVFRLL